MAKLKTISLTLSVLSAVSGAAAAQNATPNQTGMAMMRLNAAQLFDQFGGFGFVCRQVGLPERHAAADVVADKCGIEMRHAEKCRANRIAAPCVQIGHAGRAADVR